MPFSDNTSEFGIAGKHILDKNNVVIVNAIGDAAAITSLDRNNRQTLVTSMRGC